LMKFTHNPDLETEAMNHVNSEIEFASKCFIRAALNSVPIFK
jgi:hypothetical protein